MLIPTTQLQTGGPGLVVIGDQTLSGSANAITFSGISQSYTHLRLITMLRTDDANNNTFFRFNGDTGANYDWENFLVSATSSAGWTSTQGVADTSMTVGYCGSATAPADEFGMYEYLVPFYTSGRLKKIMGGGHVRTAASSGNIYRIDGGGTWRSTATITQVSVSASSNFVANSRVVLYGA